MSDARDNCDCIHVGDVVEHKMNTNVFGIVVGFMGSLVGIQVAPTLEVLWFQEWTLRVVDDERYDGGDGEDNVVPVDFTKKVRLDKKTKTRGAA